jgi:hypothetical protein
MRSGRDLVVRRDGFFRHQFVAEHAGLFPRRLGRKAAQQDQQRPGDRWRNTSARALHHSALRSSGTSPNFLITSASLKTPVAGSPVRLNATAPT